MTIDYAALARKISSEYTERANNLRDDRMLSSSGRAHEISWAYDKAKKRIDRYREKYEEQRIKTHARLARELFGLSDTANSSTVVAFRDAMDRARTLIPKPGQGSITSSIREAQSMLRTAELSGDKQLAKAIFAIAHENQWNDVTDAYVASRPGTAEKLAELDATAEPKGLFEDWDNQNAFFLPEPAEYLMDHQRMEYEISVQPFPGLAELDAPRAEAVGGVVR